MRCRMLSMATFGDILRRYEDGEIDRQEALAELLEFGIEEVDAKEALRIASGESDLMAVAD